ncbi:hypothetical protein KEM55_005725, partial [Ascosphaera atra]
MFRGERFRVDISDDEEDAQIPQSDAVIPGMIQVGDIKERNASAPPPPAPKATTTTGFPEHKKRTRQSAFRRQRAGAPDPPRQTQPLSSASPLRKPTLEEEKKQIDEENRRKLAAMSASTIKDEREELMDSMPASLLERFLRRAKIDEDTEEQQKPPSPSRDRKEAEATQDGPSKPKKSVSFAEQQENNDEETTESDIAAEQAAKDESDPYPEQLPPNPPPGFVHAPSEFPLGPIHFPKPPPRQDPPPELDPNSPSFLEDLHNHYFPDLSLDPASLSWLRPSTSPYTDAPTNEKSAYHPESIASSVAPAGVRFSMLGTILAPNTSLSLPTTLGLHHHAADPEAAGYTIPELAILSRSTVPTQRCIAWQILGRILFRLGKGEFGERGSTLVEGLWSTVERENVVARMLAEASGGEN